MKYNPSIVSAFFVDCGLPAPEFEFRFHETRKWRFDLAWPKEQVAVEVQGGIWIAGRHNRGGALLKEWEKLNAAASAGWRILYCQPKDLTTLEFAERILTALNPNPS